MEYPTFANKTAEIDFMRKHQAIIIAEKKMITKYSDVLTYRAYPINDRGEAIKADGAGGGSEVNLMDADKIEVLSVINTTMIRDSHKDVHINGLWKRSLGMIKDLMLLETHVMSFRTIISDEVKASTKMYTWVDLGFEFEGKTQALLFNSIIEKDRNEYMFEQYVKGRVKNHSVGMRYVKVGFATANDKYPAEKALWDKYIKKIANQEEVELDGYFWAVEEAKIMEGSAVPMGSNFVTPTLDVSSSNKILDPSLDTQETADSSKDTQKRANNLYF